MIKLIKKFRKDEKAGVIVFFALSLFVLTGSAGVAVDFSRAMLVRSKLTTAVDAAGTATLKVASPALSNAELQRIAQKFFRANFPEGFFGTGAPALNIALSGDYETLDINASVEMPTTFLAAFFTDSVEVSFEAQMVKPAIDRPQEIVFVLDRSGSMNDPIPDSPSRLQALKDGFSNMMGQIDALIPDPDKIDISVVAFNHDVGPVLPYGSDTATARGFVNGINASGATALNEGIREAWNQISPANGAVSFNSTSVDKIMIIMADGFNAGTTKDMADKENKEVVSLCQRLKEKGVRVITIGFNILVDPRTDDRVKKYFELYQKYINTGRQPRTVRAQEILRGCASSPADAYVEDVTTAADLARVFANIVATLKSVRISQ